jgi:hypothetical protein
MASLHLLHWLLIGVGFLGAILLLRALLKRRGGG